MKKKIVSVLLSLMLVLGLVVSGASNVAYANESDIATADAGGDGPSLSLNVKSDGEVKTPGTTHTYTVEIYNDGSEGYHLDEYSIVVFDEYSDWYFDEGTELDFNYKNTAGSYIQATDVTSYVIMPGETFKFCVEFTIPEDYTNDKKIRFEAVYFEGDNGWGIIDEHEGLYTRVDNGSDLMYVKMEFPYLLIPGMTQCQRVVITNERDIEINLTNFELYNMFYNGDTEKVEVTFKASNGVDSLTLSDIQAVKLGKNESYTFFVCYTVPENLSDDSYLEFRAYSGGDFVFEQHVNPYSGEVEDPTLNGWVTDGEDTYYYYNGMKCMNGVYTIDGKKYHFDWGGFLGVDVIRIWEGIPYYADENGVLTDLREAITDTEGKVNVFSWNTEIGQRIKLVTDAYPEYEDKIVVWNLDCSGTGYDYMDFVNTISQEDYPAIICMDNDAVLSGYVDMDNFDPVSNIGIEAADYENAYKYTKEIGTFDSELKLLTWQVCPNVMFYNKAIAEEVLGTSDPEEIQKLVATPEAFYETAEKVEKAGYTMAADVNLINYHINFAQSHFNKIDGADDFVSTVNNNGYTTGSEGWSTEWYNELNGEVFCVFGSTWYEWVIPSDIYMACEGPVNYYYSGSFLGVAGTGNDAEGDAVAAFVLEKLCCDDEFMQTLFAEGDAPNNKKAAEALIAEGKGTKDFVFDQNILAIYDASARDICGEEKAEYEKEILTGWQNVSGKWFYYDEAGKMQTGWVKDNGKWYYLNNNGEMQTGWVLLGGKWYYLNSGGAMQTGWGLIDGKWYYFNSNGEMQIGWVNIGGKWYYLNSGGAMQTGWGLVNGKWYYFNSDGTMKTGWINIGGKWYYLNPGGDMQTGWGLISGNWYYFISDGVMQTGWVLIGGKWYYLNSNGEMQTGWEYISKAWYYFTSAGDMVTGRYKIGSTTYLFNSSGVWIN